MERLNPLSDAVFSNMFQDMSSAPAMLGFINAVLEAAGDDPIKEIVSIHSQYAVLAERIGAKNGRIDVRADSSDNQIVDTEVQLRAGLDMNERDVFYGGRLLGENFSTGETYQDVPRVRIINILDYVIRKDHEDYLQPIGLGYKKVECPKNTLNDNMCFVEATDALRIYHIQLPLFRKQFTSLESVKGNPLAIWLYMMDRGYMSESEMEVLAGMTEGMQTFAKRYNLAMNDPRVRELYELDQSARMDEASRIRNAHSAGRA